MSWKPANPGDPLPDTLGAMVDEYAATREWRLTMEKLVDPVRQRETELREAMTRRLYDSDQNDGDTGAAGRRYRVQLRLKQAPRVIDWPVFYSYVREHGRFDLLEKRLSSKAALDMADAGQQCPGTEVYVYPDISVTKI